MRPTKLSITHKFRSDHENLGNLGIIFLRSVYIAAMLYAAIRILEGLIIIALQSSLTISSNPCRWRMSFM